MPDVSRCRTGKYILVPMLQHSMDAQRHQFERNSHGSVKIVATGLKECNGTLKCLRWDAGVSMHHRIIALLSSTHSQILFYLHTIALQALTQVLHHDTALVKVRSGSS